MSLHRDYQKILSCYNEKKYNKIMNNKYNLDIKTIEQASEMGINIKDED